MKTEELDKREQELEKVIEGLPSPYIGLSHIDETSNGICRSLILRTSGTIDGPSRALQLTPWSTSEGRLVNSSDHQGFVEMFYRFNQGKYDEFVESIEAGLGIPNRMKSALDQQAQQDDDSFRIVNFEISQGVDCEDTSVDWYPELVRQIGEMKAGFLYPPIPRDVKELEGILSYTLRAAEANLGLANPMTMAGYIPPGSAGTACDLIDTLFRVGIRVFVIDARDRKMNSKPFVRLASLSATKNEDNQIFVHQLQTNPHHKRTPLDTVQDLLSPTYGVHSFSNLRWPGGGGDPSKDNLRVKCIHSYVSPKLEKIVQGKYSCPECETDALKADYEDLTSMGFRRN